MKTYITKILLFFIIVALIDVVFGMGCDYLYKNSKGGDTYKINYAISEGTADVLIMGSSRASHHYNPQILSDSLNMSVYNLGIDGSGVILADGFYRLIAERYKPKYIIYELTPSFDIYQYSGDVNNTRYLSQLKPYHTKACIAKIFNDVDSKELIKLHSGFYRYNTQFLNLFRFYIKPENQCNDGFAPLMGEMSMINKKDIGKTTHRVPVVDSLKLSYLKQFIDDCCKHGTQLIFVISPSFGVRSSSDYSPAVKVCKGYGFPVLDNYCDSSFVDNPYLFKDSYHLNEKGACLYTQEVASEIKRCIKE